jgi:hypothetical protein
MYKSRCFEEESMQGDKMSMDPSMFMECGPIVETPCERVCHREICHNVEHIQPVNTRIINHHVYHHTYVPCYTCCEENEISNVYGPNPCCR